MTLTDILLFGGLGLAAGLATRWLGRGWVLFGLSALAAFWLQPPLAVRNLDFLLPAASLGLAGLTWALTRKDEESMSAQDKWAAAALAGIVLALSASRFVEPLCCVSASRPPQPGYVLMVLGVVGLLGFAMLRVGRGRPAALNGMTRLIILAFVILKTPGLAVAGSRMLRGMTGQNTALATGLDLEWLGFSYIAFRLMHTLRDRVSGRLPDVSLRDFVTYIVFFPALSAGPIDRVEHFQAELVAGYQPNTEALLAAGKRLAQGLFMKFVLADSLAFFALNPVNAEQVQSSDWMWVLLLAYTLRIFFDFAGYTHIAVGIGLLFGVRLPENFDQPYLKRNLTQFWNSWHITLAHWFRAYFFNPVTRWLRGRRWPVWTIILLGQLGTMALIGLWHGVTVNFLIWGLWHGAGLFVHNRWVEWRKGRSEPRHWGRVAGGVATFLFVALGWVWFVLPEPEQALRVLRILFGVASW